MAGKPSSKSLAWPLFDAIVDRSAFKDVNPWTTEGTFSPDYDALRKLLAVPILLGAESRSGVPALALDVWVAYELRRAGLDPDAVWPRAEAPRVVDRDVLNFVRSIPKSARNELMERLRAGGGIGAASANIAGKNYFKQVDVIMSSWQTGPELLISTKRMDSSFGKNAANRVEESYGDAKNLALRHPLAALGFMYSLRSTAYTEERRQFDWIVDLLIKLGREDDAYDACALVVPEWMGDGPIDEPPPADDAVIEPYLFDIEEDLGDAHIDSPPAVDVTAQLAALPDVTLRTDLVPDELTPARFFARMLTIVLDNSNITQHEEARLRRSQAVG
ncbi:hypothetical protein [Mycolicibacterium iranicum]|uniref:Uncharacterized protein n=1 Tax=Mycolicibacterium iranicum TaxID=912594 RepID=A0A1X1WMX5_MYCIR|nr:hypothetical protein [Mycolicibacterium iranicum]ORV87888.1 hypothetical protein AWC12_16275 [Mycolicibacterium iranicum]